MDWGAGLGSDISLGSAFKSILESLLPSQY